MSTRATRRRAALLGWLASAWLLLACTPALAHANLVGASPPREGEVSKPPERVELRFTEPVDLEFDPLVVRDGDGARVDERDARVDPEDARVVLAGLEKLSEGSYTVEWRVTSIDGHVVEGRYGFAVVDGAANAGDTQGAAGPGAGVRRTEANDRNPAWERHDGHDGHGGHPGQPSPDQLRAMAEIDRGFALATTALLAGLAPFAALVWLPASREIGEGREAIGRFGLVAWGLLYVLVFAGAGELAAYAMRASGEPFGFALLREALLETRVGTVWLVRIGFALLTAALITAAARWGLAWLWWAAVGAGALLLATLTGLSHAAATGRPLPLVADWTHTLAAAVWMGGLLGFAVALFSRPLRGLPPDQRAKLRERSVRRFSVVATTAVVVLACTGLYAAVLHVPNPQALVATPYGRALLAKLALLILLLGVGASNLLLRGRGPFGRLVVVELLLALGVFVATGFLTSLPPPSGA